MPATQPLTPLILREHKPIGYVFVEHTSFGIARANALPRFGPERRQLHEFWTGDPEVDRCWVPWDWCKSELETRRNNSIVVFVPSDGTLHGVKRGSLPGAGTFLIRVYLASDTGSVEGNDYELTIGAPPSIPMLPVPALVCTVLAFVLSGRWAARRAGPRGSVGPRR